MMTPWLCNRYLACGLPKYADEAASAVVGKAMQEHAATTNHRRDSQKARTALRFGRPKATFL
jgi:hypothetical protein